MKTVFLVQHTHERLGHEDVKLIGVYATLADAQAAVARLRTQPGFSFSEDGFHIDEYPLGQDHWTDGFVVNVNIMVPTTAGEAQHVCAGATWTPGDHYEITDFDDEVAASALAFQIGDVVRCETQDWSDRPVLVAVALHSANG